MQMTQEILHKHKLTQDEYASIEKILGRSPTYTELGVFSAMWSEHCSYKSSKVHLRRLPTTGPNVVQGPGENAGVVRLHGKLCVAFKMESHNHPSYIDPYQGAATGVGGILRDVFCMGARPICNLNALRFGEKSHPKTPWLMDGVVRGIGNYGNCVGIPTVGGCVSFDSSYNGNILVNAMTVGLIHEDRIFKGYASGEGNLVVYVGSATGRDGVHGATMASGSFDAEAEKERSAIQVGDPFFEKLLLEATLEVLEADLVVGIQDMGAAGLTSSLFEMADRAGSGLAVDLDQVPVRSQNLSAYELMLSESQERMLMVVRPENWPKLRAVFEKWQLAYGIIGKVTNTERMQAHYQGKLEIDVPVPPLSTSAPCYERPMQKRERTQGERTEAEVASACLAKIHELGEFVNESKRGIYTQYDHHIGRKTTLGPEEEGAAVLWIRHEESRDLPYLGLLAATACQEKLCRIDPRRGAAYSVLKAARMIAACGGEPLAITDCLNYGNPENPEVMWEFSEGVNGISDACLQFGIPVVSGNVSLYNETNGKSIAPTPMIGMVGRMEDVRLALPAVAKEAGELWLLSSKDDQGWFSGSLLAEVLGIEGGTVPEPNWEAEKEAMGLLRAMAMQGVLQAARDVGEGGVWLTISRLAGEAYQGPFPPLDPSLLGFKMGAYLLATKRGHALRVEVRDHCKLSKIGELVEREGTLCVELWES